MFFSNDTNLTIAIVGSGGCGCRAGGVGRGGEGAEGSERHAGKNYYLSTDVLNGTEVAGVLSSATARPIQALVMTPDDLAVGIASGQVVMPGYVEANYAASMLEWARQTFDGRMGYSAVTTDTVATLLGRPPIKLEDWARQHRSDIAA